jgi:hypothetical protein
MVPSSQIYTRPPLDMVMPHPAEEITFAIFAGGAVLLVLYGLYLAIRERSWLPIIILIGAQLSFSLEGPADVMGNALYPPIGQDNAHSMKGHTIPWFVVPVYIWYVGLLPLTMYRAFLLQQVSRRTWWIIAAASFAGVAAIEQIPVYFGLWTYYGVQPLKIGLMPMWLIAANTACVMVPTVLIYRMIPRLTGARQWLLVPLIPAGCAMGHAGSGIFMYNVLGGSTETMPLWILYAGTLATVALALVVIHVFIEWAGEPQPEGAGVA